MSFNFEITKKSSKSSARTGVITTPHGTIKTPAFVACATKGTLKSLTPEDIETIGTQLLFVNTYHMVISPGIDILEKAGGIHAFSKINKPLITDSGGFQVFSLARQDESPHLVKITDDGVRFKSHTDGTEYFFTPEFSIQAQKKIGADLIVAFDECLPAGASHKQTERSISRTHDWAKRSLDEFSLSPHPTLPTSRTPYPPHLSSSPQSIYGVIQGGMFKDLRRKSAEYISSLPFWGLAIGGVSVGETKKEMREQVSWATDVLGTDPRPRHLLGVGEFDDIADLVKLGIDTFDCVLPTRHARNGHLYSSKESYIDITKLLYKSDFSRIDSTCTCYTCINFSRAYIHHLFKQRELLAYRLATMHNLYYMERFMERIRKKIEDGTL